MMQFFCCQCKYISFVRRAKHKSLIRIFKSVETEGISNFLVKWCTCTDKGACVWPVKARFQTCAFGSDVYFANKDKPNNTKKQSNLTCAHDLKCHLRLTVIWLANSHWSSYLLCSAVPSKQTNPFASGKWYDGRLMKNSQLPTIK